MDKEKLDNLKKIFEVCTGNICSDMVVPVQMYGKTMNDMLDLIEDLYSKINEIKDSDNIKEYIKYNNTWITKKKISKK